MKHWYCYKSIVDQNAFYKKISSVKLHTMKLFNFNDLTCQLKYLLIIYIKKKQTN